MPLFYGLIRTLQLSLLFTAVAMRSSSNSVLAEQQSTSSDIRNLQQTLNYRANYTADFQHITDPSCTGDAPVLQISCLSAQNMTILSKSSESIKCSPIDLSGIQGDTSYQCVNTCNGTSCNDVYLSTLIEQPKDGPYGSIQFMCEGNDFRQVDAAFIFLGGNNGSCTAANTSSPGVSRNLHIAKFGISCPSQSSNGGIGGPREYVYDDAYFECNFSGSSTASASAFDSSEGSSDVYTCLTGGNCNGTECTDIQFNDIIIDSVVPKFLASCVETTLPSITEIPSQSPVIRAVGDTISNVRFEALWANLHGPDTALTTCRYVNNTAVLISCGNGATDIRFRSSTDPNMNCTNVNDVDLYCIGDETKIKNQFTSVVYDCYGGTIATSQATFPETRVVCDGNNVDVEFQNSVMMGVECEGETYRYYSDILFECGSPSHQFYIYPSNKFNLYGDRITCSESTNISSGSSASVVQVIPSVSITTDSLWLRNPILACVNMVDSIPTPAPFVTTQTPLLMPTIAPAASVLPPVTSPVTSNTNAPVPIVPTIASSPMTNTSSKVNSSVFAVVGGVVGGIAISLIVLYMYRKGKSDGISDKYNNNVSGSQSNGSTDQLTQGNSDHLTRNSGSTNKRSSSSATGTSQSGMSASDVQSPGRLLPTTSATVNASNAYVIDYKDQARSVDNAFPVMNSARRVDTGPAPYHDMPIAMAVPMTETTAAYQGTVVNAKQMPSNKAALLDL